MQLPYLKSKLPVMVNHFNIGADRGDQAGNRRRPSSIIGSHQLQLARVFLHQIFETLERDDFTESHRNSFCVGLRTRDVRGFIGQVGIEADRSHGLEFLAHADLVGKKKRFRIFALAAEF
jgi:hypothetical protein